MRRVFTMSLTLLLLAGLVGGGVASARDGSAGQRDGKRVQELTLYATETSSVFVTASGEVLDDEAEIPPGPGDRFLVVDTLFSDPERTVEVGRNLIECTLITASGETEEDFAADILCHGVVTLTDQGDLAWQAQFRAPEAFVAEPFVTVAITGGTGAFERAGGSVEIFDESPEDESETLSRYEVRLLTFRLARAPG